MINKLLAVAAAVALTVTGLTFSDPSAANAVGGGDNSEGQITSIRPLPGGYVEVKGYVFDYSQPDQPSAVAVQNNTSNRVVEMLADEPGYNLEAWGVTGNHGFTVKIAGIAGVNNQICGQGLDIHGPGERKDLGCHTVFVPANATVEGMTKQRLAGADRYQTSVFISQLANPRPVHTVYLVTGEKFPDALSVTPAAARPGYGLLLTPGGHMTEPVKNELKRLNPTKVILIGDTSSLSSTINTIVKQVVPTATISRIAGADRYQTSVLIAKHAFPTATEAFVASGENFPDALSAAPTAALAGAPVILVPSNGMVPVTTAWFRDMNLAKVTVAGSTKSVSAANYTSIATLTQATMVRHAGVDRWETNRLLAAQGASDAKPTVLLASGQNFPDALSAAAAAPKVGPLLLSTSGCIPTKTFDMIKHTYSPDKLFVIGGETTLADSVYQLGLCSF